MATWTARKLLLLLRVSGATMEVSGQLAYALDGWVLLGEPPERGHGRDRVGHSSKMVSVETVQAVSGTGGLEGEVYMETCALSA